uniref:Cytochrome b5 heme-binding domain-containing protein n=1 Tax=Rhabditophanes sp. KR3021 TaxID=114890 RepID=A0AC35TLD2_9BILA
MNEYTTQEVAQKNSTECFWVIFNAKVYDMTTFLDGHPGGKVIMKHGGKDVSSILPQVAVHNMTWSGVQSVLKERCIGTVKGRH